MATPMAYPVQNISVNAAVNPLDKGGEKKMPNNIYDDKDQQYLNHLQWRLENAKKQKDQPWTEYKGKTVYQYFNENEKIANTHLPERKNDDDVIVSAGTVEAKLDALLSNMNNLNLTPEVFAFDKDKNQIDEIGQALEDIMIETSEQDGGDGAGDEEKRMSRQRELLKQGTVFVQEEWVRRFEMKKKLKKEFDGKFKQDADFYSQTLEKVFEGPSRTLLYGPNVYLGDITEFYMERQPYVFVAIRMDYEIAKTVYGKFENFQYVKPGKIPTTNADDNKTIYDNRWRLTELEQNQVEIILYQDQPKDEFQILINGVCMLPIGFPLSAVSPLGKYNIAKQVFRVLSDKFAYGGSFVAAGSVKEISVILDEMLKLFVLKTRKSFTPAYVNTSGRVIDRKVLSPGRISMGFDASSLTPIQGNEVQGVTAGELGVFKELQDLINRSTVSEQFTGQPGRSGTTATEVLELQRQARLTLGLTIAACALLEKKLAWLRLYNILQNWFSPVETRVKGVNEARKLLNDYRKTNREVNIPNEGKGRRKVIPTDETLPTPEEIRNEELAEEKLSGTPTRNIYLSPQGLKTANIIWYIVVNPRERESSPYYKVAFREELADLVSMVQLGIRPNMEAVQDEFARAYNKPRTRLFENQSQVLPGDAGVSSAAPGGTARAPLGRGNSQGAPQLPAGLTAGLV